MSVAVFCSLESLLALTPWSVVSLSLYILISIVPCIDIDGFVLFFSTNIEIFLIFLFLFFLLVYIERDSSFHSLRRSIWLSGTERLYINS